MCVLEVLQSVRECLVHLTIYCFSNEQGGWSSEGIETVIDGETGTVTCLSSHLTSFAVLGSTSAPGHRDSQENSTDSPGNINGTDSRENSTDSPGNISGTDSRENSTESTDSNKNGTESHKNVTDSSENNNTLVRRHT